MRVTLDCSFTFIFGLVEMWQSPTWTTKMMMISSLKSMSKREAPNLQFQPFEFEELVLPTKFQFFSCITRYKIAEELGGGEHTQSSFYLALHSEGLYLACSGWIQFQQHLLFLSPHRCCMLCVPATRTNIFHWNHGECCVTGIFLNVSYFNETIFGY